MGKNENLAFSQEQGEKAPERLKEGEFEKIFQNKERAFFDGGVNYKDMLAFLDGISCLNEKEEEKRIFLHNMYQGMFEHENVNINSDRFKIILSESAEKHRLEYENLSRKQVFDEYEDYEKKDELEKQEKKALQLYRMALENWRGGDSTFISGEEIEALILDIEYRRAKRIKEPKKRKQELSTLKRQHKIIAEGIDFAGLRAEAQFVYLLNEWLERNKKDHLVDVYHSLPLDDRKEKIDVEIVVGDAVLNINLKSFDPSKDPEESRAEVRENEKKKIKNSNIEIVELDIDKIKEVWIALEEENPDTEKKKLITRAINNLVGETGKNALKLVQGKKETQKEVDNSKGLTRKTIFEKHSNVKNLLAWGYLEKGGKLGMPEILEAKARLGMDLEDDKVFQKIKRRVAEELSSGSP